MSPNGPYTTITVSEPYGSFAESWSAASYYGYAYGRYWDEPESRSAPNPRRFTAGRSPWSAAHHAWLFRRPPPGPLGAPRAGYRQVARRPAREPPGRRNSRLSRSRCGQGSLLRELHTDRGRGRLRPL